MPSSVQEVISGAEDALTEYTGSQDLSGALEKLIWAAVLVVVGLVVIKLLLRLLDRAMGRFDLDAGIRRLLRSGLRIVMLFVLILIVLSYLDISITSLVAVLSVVGLALSLAVQNLLSNVAGGIQLLSTKPFAPGDFIEAGGVSGTVAEAGTFYTKLRTIDNKLIQVPNSEIAGEKITNYSAEALRRVDLTISASYDAPIELVKGTIQRVLGEHPKTLATPEPLVRVMNFGASSIDYVVRVWCANADYWEVYFDVLEGVKAAFDANGIEMTYNHLNVHMIQDRKEKASTP